MPVSIPYECMYGVCVCVHQRADLRPMCVRVYRLEVSLHIASPPFCLLPNQNQVQDQKGHRTMLIYTSDKACPPTNHQEDKLPGNVQAPMSIKFWAIIRSIPFNCSITRSPIGEPKGRQAVFHSPSSHLLDTYRSPTMSRIIISSHNYSW